MIKLLLLSVLAAFTAKGGDFAGYYQDLPTALEQPATPVIPALTVSLADFGGVGDGITSNTEKPFPPSTSKAADTLSSLPASG